MERLALEVRGEYAVDIYGVESIKNRRVLQVVDCTHGTHEGKKEKINGRFKQNT